MEERLEELAEVLAAEEMAGAGDGILETEDIEPVLVALFERGVDLSPALNGEEAELPEGESDSEE